MVLAVLLDNQLSSLKQIHFYRTAVYSLAILFPIFALYILLSA